MAKRTPRSEADDSAAAAPARPSRSATNQADQPGQQVQPRETFAARPGAQTDEAALTGVPQGADAAADENGPSEDDIRNRAYQLYLERGGGHGMHFDDWLQAEKELKKR